MRSLSKMALSAAMLAGVALGMTAPASAGVSVGVSVGVPGVAVGPAYPCNRPFRFRPAYCGYPVYGQPLFVDGVAYRGPVYVRTVGSERYFWMRGRWQRDRAEWHRDRDVR